jgi:hypothetical protein
MTDAAPAIFIAIEGSALGAAIRQSSFAYFAANVGHIVFLMIFAGAIAVMDLRLVGVFANTAPDRVVSYARRTAMVAFAGMLLTGGVMFIAEASHIILNPVFLFKLGLIGLGLLNVALFEIFTAPKLRDLPPLAPLPGAARTAGIASLAIWLAVAICGRSIAYF